MLLSGQTVKPAPTARGFTLIELLVTISIAAILLALAAPSFRALLMNSRLSSGVNTFSASIDLARSNALNQAMAVTMCPFSAPASTACGNNWSAGWIVVGTPDGGVPALLQSYQSGPHDPSFTAVGINGATAATSINFDSRGLATTMSGFAVCDTRGSAYAQSLEILVTGSVQIGSTPGQAIWGGAITCP